MIRDQLDIELTPLQREIDPKIEELKDWCVANKVQIVALLIFPDYRPSSEKPDFIASRTLVCADTYEAAIRMSGALSYAVFTSLQPKEPGS